MTETAHYLPAGLPAPLDEERVNAPYWQGLTQGVLRVQRCAACGTWQFGGEWLCHHCHAFDPPWVEVAPRGRIFSWERVWHPVHPALKERGPYLAVLVELPEAGGLRMLGNLLGDAMQEVTIGAEVEGVFEHHAAAEVPYSLLQWRRT
ncbi:MAG: OB-fold domain-containing protein [Rubrivivax sp.]|nr:OB-fold domain-containing protein [Rubrivivax sp.]